MQILPIIAYASGLAGNHPGCAEGPAVLQQSKVLQRLNTRGWQVLWQEILSADVAKMSGLAAFPAVVSLCRQLAKITQQLSAMQQLFCVVGGDHSSAIGTWSGVYAGITQRYPAHRLGLVWFDAHLDSHTPETTLSGNIHGMPLACLLGYGEQRLSKLLGQESAIIKAQHVSVIGARSWETAEYQLLERLKVKVYTMAEIQRRGLQQVFAEAIARASIGTQGYGISLDLDVIDPNDVPGVGTPAVDGIELAELLQALQYCRGDKRLLGIEIAEFNPSFDKNGITLQAIAQILLNLL